MRAGAAIGEIACEQKDIGGFGQAQEVRTKTPGHGRVHMQVADGRDANALGGARWGHNGQPAIPAKGVSSDGAKHVRDGRPGRSRKLRVHPTATHREIGI